MFFIDLLTFNKKEEDELETDLDKWIYSIKNMGTELTGTQKLKLDKEKTRRDRLACYFYDLSKLIFAGTIITNIPMFLNIDTVTIANIVVMVFGLLWTYILASIANRTLTY